MRNDFLKEGGDIYRKFAIGPFMKETCRFSNNRGGAISTEQNPLSVAEMISVTREKLFVPSYVEVYGPFHNGMPAFEVGGHAEWSNKEGYQYEYWKDICGIVRTGAGAIPSLVKWNSGGVAVKWALRKPPTVSTTTFNCVGESGDQGDPGDAAQPVGIAPAFCL